MQDKHNKKKVTLYLPPELHRQLKIRAAVDAEPMSVLAEHAIDFYLTHAEVVNQVEAAVQGETHQVYACPECATSVVLRSGELSALPEQSHILSDDGLQVQSASTAEELVASRG